jgi:hypothetical protein
MDKKPNVFPTQVKTTESNAETLNQGQQVSNNDPIGNSSQVPAGETAAAEEMKRRTAEELALRNHAEERTAASVADGNAAREALMVEMDKKNPQQTQVTPQQTQELQGESMSYEDMVRFQEYSKQIEAKQATANVEVPPSSMYNQQPPVQQVPPAQPPVVPPTPPSNYGKPNDITPSEPDDVYIQQLSQPQMNSAFDVIPLPSGGKLYKGIGKNIKVAYMSTADENILTSPNLLKSGKFLEILINRKILEPNLRYRDLVEGDRNAIMLWLRATGYGNMYPVEVEDEKGVPFETDVDLNDIKTIELSKKPDSNGHFEFKLPISGLVVKFKLLTVGEQDDIAERVEYEVDTLKLPINNTNTYTLAKQLVSVNGDTNPELIKSFSENMRVGDAKELREYIDSIDCGVDLRITVRTPGGGSVTTFLPLNLKFFWPNFGI